MKYKTKLLELQNVSQELFMKRKKKAYVSFKKAHGYLQ